MFATLLVIFLFVATAGSFLAFAIINKKRTDELLENSGRYRRVGLATVRSDDG